MNVLKSNVYCAYDTEMKHIAYCNPINLSFEHTLSICLKCAYTFVTVNDCMTACDGPSCVGVLPMPIYLNGGFNTKQEV